MCNSYIIAASAATGAISQHFKALADALVERGHEVALILDKQRHDLVAPSARPAVYTWPSKRPTKLRDARFLGSLIRKYCPDCLIANFSSVNLMMMVGGLMSVPRRVAWYRTLSTQIDRDSTRLLGERKYQRMRKRIVYRMATHIVANSRAASADVQTIYQMPAAKCQVFPNALADPLAHGDFRELAKKANRILCVGRLYPTKGQDVLIRAFAQILPDVPDLHLELVGDGPSRAAYQELACSMGVGRQCTFTGAVRHHQVLKKMAAARVSVVPSRSEAFGWVNVESMAVGTPVIASAVGGIPDIIRDGIDGFLVPPDDPDTLAARLRTVVTDPGLAMRMGANAREHFLERFEYGKVIEAQADWFERIVA